MTFRFLPADGEGREPPYEPHLSFSDHAWRRLKLMTVRCPYEISGIGYVMEDGRDFVLEDLFVVPQDVNDIATRLDDESVHRLIVEVVDKGLDPSGLRLWWHSHAKEGVFWSGEDEQTIDRFRNDGMISLVTNHEMKALARLDHYWPRRTSWVWIDFPRSQQEGDEAVSSAELDRVDEEIATKLTHLPRKSARIM